ncbi:metal-dependent hydrolase [Flavobacterium sp. JP2137]|uniref:metal-dependent hydrolase n=1 Tax=Flavobacterium sp. JP2137 TaxID=3414510 RepID=UPI003D2FFEEF
MDSLTQIVLGAAIGNAVLGKKLKNRAVLYGAIAGTIPDLDVVLGLFLDPIYALEIHRGLSHSFLFATLFALVFGYALHRWERHRGVSFKEGFSLVLWGLVTHSFLDVFTTWGTQLLWPWNFSFAFKSIFVVDPLYTLPFVYFLIRSMRETSNMKRRMKWNTYGLVVSSAYLALTLLLKWAAYERFEDSLVAEKVAYRSLVVKPTAFNTILWNAIVETDTAYRIGSYSFLDTAAITYEHYDKNWELIGSIREEPVVRRLIGLSQGEYVISQVEDSLFFNDLRFGLLKSDSTAVQFAFSYYLFEDPQGEWQAVEVKKDKRDGVLLLQNLWIRLRGN